MLIIDLFSTVSDRASVPLFHFNFYFAGVFNKSYVQPLIYDVANTD